MIASRMIPRETAERRHAESQAEATEIHGRLEAAAVAERASAVAAKERLSRTSGMDRVLQERIYAMGLETVEHLGHLLASMYFMRCELRFLDTGEAATVFLAKHTFLPERIYSWVTPIAELRYAPIGKTSYVLPDGGTRPVELRRRDQLLIVGDRIQFQTTETPDEERTLVYQAHFSQRKTEFALKDIVAQMEKAQDAVVRAAAADSMLISGPAGSGKTTLALHRLAYLAQAPETAPVFVPRNMVVFVQDASSQAYFAGLLPELGIHGVEITTFDAWAKKILDIDAPEPTLALRRDRRAYDEYLFQKRRAVARAVPPRPSARLFPSLAQAYAPFFDEAARALFARQANEGSLDRYDIVLLLRRRLEDDGLLYVKTAATVASPSGKLVKKTKKTPMFYAGIVVDEVQNYLPEQILVLKRSIDTQTRALLYIGDLAQQTRIGALRDWAAVGEAFAPERHIHLEKAYRSTRQIADYVRSRGFASVPDGLRDGPEAVECSAPTFDAACLRLAEILSTFQGKLAGVVGTDAVSVAAYRDAVQMRFPDVRFLSAEEAQGVEFSAVCVLDASSEASRHFSEIPELRAEQERIARDRLYVACTRAMDELCVLKCPLDR